MVVVMAAVETGSTVIRKGQGRVREGIVEKIYPVCGHTMRFHFNGRDIFTCDYKPRQYAKVRWGSYSRRWNGEQLNTPITAVPVSRLRLA